MRTLLPLVRSTKEANYLRRFAAGFHEQKNDIFRNFMIDFDSQLCYNKNDKHFLSGFLYCRRSGIRKQTALT